MSNFTPKSERLERLIAAAPEMYALLKSVADYHAGTIWDVQHHARQLLSRIDGSEVSE